MTARFFLILSLLLSFLALAEGKPFISTDSIPGRLTIPIGGNTFLTAAGGNDQVMSFGIKEWKSPQSVFSTFVHLSHSQTVILHLDLEEQAVESEIGLSTGSQTKELVIPKGTTVITVGEITLTAGYNRITFRGINGGDGNFADIKALYLDPALPSTCLTKCLTKKTTNGFTVSLLFL